MRALFAFLLLIACGHADPPIDVIDAITPNRDGGPVAHRAACTPAAGAVRHVSPDGSDDADGSAAAPWRTIARGVTALAPGDALYLGAGVYREAVVITVSGTAAAPILIASDPAGVAAEIDGQGLALDEDGLVSIVGASHVHLCGLAVRNSAGHGISVQDDEHGNIPAGVAVIGLSVSEARGTGIYAEHVAGIDIEDNATRETLASGIGVWYSQGAAVRGNTVVNARNDDENGHEEWISIAGVCDFEVAGNELYMDHADFGGHTGIDAKESSCRGAIHHNYIHDFPGYGGQIYLDAWEAGLHGTSTLSWIDIYSNRLDGAGGITIGSEQGGIVENIRVFNNVIVHPWTSGILVAGLDGEGGMYARKRHIHIYNNSVWGSRNHGTSAIYLLATNAEDIVVRNNLVWMDPDYTVGRVTAGTPAAVAPVIVDHNLSFGPTACANDHPDCVELSAGAGNLVAEPALVNGPGGDLHLLPGSPAIDQGAAIEDLAEDFDGVTRPQGAGLDIGAFERVPDGPTTRP